MRDGRLRPLPSVALAAVLVLAASLPAAAQSLTDVLATTYSTNPQLMAGRAELRATNELVPQALSGWRPTIAGTANIGRTWIDSEVGSTSINPR